jgi:hypothetical protein
MTIDELIKLMRAERSGPHRKRITETIHEIERFSLGTEVDAGSLSEDDLKAGRFKFALKGETLSLRK